MNNRNYNRNSNAFFIININFNRNSNDEKLDNFNSNRNRKIWLDIILIVIEIRIGFDYHPCDEAEQFYNRYVSISCIREIGRKS
jgi:hypothetical protein